MIFIGWMIFFELSRFGLEFGTLYLHQTHDAIVCDLPIQSRIEYMCMNIVQISKDSKNFLFVVLIYVEDNPHSRSHGAKAKGVSIGPC